MNATGADDGGQPPTRDAFLGGRVLLWQPARGYRAGVDAVLLAAAVEARPGQKVLELGCGVGAAALCLAARVPGLVLTGVERDAATAALARCNAAESGAALDVVTADIAALPPEVRQIGFDHVILNPPYFRRDRSRPSDHAGREAAMGEAAGLPLAEWLAVGARRLAPGGWLTVIHRAERLGDLIAGLSPLGSVQIQPLAPREGRPARQVLVRARKHGRAPLALLPPVVMHEGPAHAGDGDDYTDTLRAILRGGAALGWGED